MIINNYLFNNIYKNNYYFIFIYYFWGWGLGIGDWAQSPIPNPQSPIPNPQSPIKKKVINKNKIIIVFINIIK